MRPEASLSPTIVHNATVVVENFVPLHLKDGSLLKTGPDGKLERVDKSAFSLGKRILAFLGFKTNYKLEKAATRVADIITHANDLHLTPEEKTKINSAVGDLLRRIDDHNKKWYNAFSHISKSMLHTIPVPVDRPPAPPQPAPPHPQGDTDRTADLATIRRGIASLKSDKIWSTHPGIQQLLPLIESVKIACLADRGLKEADVVQNTIKDAIMRGGLNINPRNVVQWTHPNRTEGFALPPDVNTILREVYSYADVYQQLARKDGECKAKLIGKEPAAIPVPNASDFRPAQQPSKPPGGVSSAEDPKKAREAAYAAQVKAAVPPDMRTGIEHFRNKDPWAGHPGIQSLLSLIEKVEGECVIDPNRKTRDEGTTAHAKTVLTNAIVYDHFIINARDVKTWVHPDTWVHPERAGLFPSLSKEQNKVLDDIRAYAQMYSDLARDKMSCTVALEGREPPGKVPLPSLQQPSGAAPAQPSAQPAPPARPGSVYATPPQSLHELPLVLYGHAGGPLIAGGEEAGLNDPLIFGMGEEAIHHKEQVRELADRLATEITKRPNAIKDATGQKRPVESAAKKFRALCELYITYDGNPKGMSPGELRTKLAGILGTAGNKDLIAAQFNPLTLHVRITEAGQTTDTRNQFLVAHPEFTSVDRELMNDLGYFFSGLMAQVRKA